MSSPPFSGAFQNTFAGSPLDRAGDRRLDAQWLSSKLMDPTSWALALWRGRLLANDQGLVMLPVVFAMTVEPDPDRLVFLGIEGKVAGFAVDIEADADPTEGGPLAGKGSFVELRALAMTLPAPHAAIAAAARSLFEWRRHHRWCSNCGQPSHAAEAGWKRICSACKSEHFPRTDPVAIMLATHGERCLLGRQAGWTPGMWSCLAGFIEPGESLEEGCARELLEESGLTATSVRYHSSQPWPFPSQLMVGFIAEVAEGEATPDQTELEAVRWFTRAEAGALLRGEIDGASAPPPLAIAHQLIKAWSEGG
jgi:NAD+ diphosphatase